MSTLLSSALPAGAILLREGLEAILIIAALAGFLRRSKAEHGLKALYLGAILAVILSIAGAAAMAVFLDGVHDDRIEAAIMAAAAVLMLYMSGWLFLKQDPRTLMGDLRRSADAAISTGTTLSFALLAFLSVLREGAETALFLHALAQSGGGWSAGVLVGIAGAAVLLAALYFAVEWFAVHLPLRPLFLVTSAFLFTMALKFIGGAVQELQELLILDVTAADLPRALVDLGFNASWEAIGVQIAVGLAALASTACVFLRARRSRRDALALASPAE